MHAAEFDAQRDVQRLPGVDQRAPQLRPAPCEFRYMTEFQSHEPEFDYLKSFEIEEKINKVRWVNHPSASRLILSTNDKTIKLWKVRHLPALYTLSCPPAMMC